MSDKNTPELNTPEANAPEAGRRRILGAGLAAPVLMSVASSPVMAVDRYCSPSGFHSGKLSAGSNPNHIKQDCGARSPGGWKQNVNWWPVLPDNVGGTPGIRANQVYSFSAGAYQNGYSLTTNSKTSYAIRFTDLFGAQGAVSPLTTNGNDKFPLAWLQAYPGGNHSSGDKSRGLLIWYLVPTYLNVFMSYGLQNFLSLTEVLEMWKQTVYENKSTYSYGGVTLTRQQLIDYLLQTQS